MALHFSAVCKRYRGRSVLDALDIAVPAGSSTAIVGLNGAGKSTLLRCLLDFIRPDSGSIHIHGRPHTDLAARAQLAWLPERFVPPAHLSARETLQWLAGLRGERLDKDAVAACADRLGLAHSALARRVGELSKGMTQKLGLMSIALAKRPVWVLDEPMSGLDPQARRDVAGLLDTARGEGRTVLFTSHGLRDLPALCDRIAVVHGGRVVFAGTPGELAVRHGAAQGGGGATPDLESAFLDCLAAADASR